MSRTEKQRIARNSLCFIASESYMYYLYNIFYIIYFIVNMLIKQLLLPYKYSYLKICKKYFTKEYKMTFKKSLVIVKFSIITCLRAEIIYFYSIMRLFLLNILYMYFIVCALFYYKLYQYHMYYSLFKNIHCALIL